MKEIPSRYLNPILDVASNISVKLSPIFYQYGLTPNNITTISLVFGLLAVYALTRQSASGVFWFGVWYLIGFVFDCMDGYYARRYRMTSKFGDWYDHLKDTLLYIAICYVLVRQYGLLRSPGSIIVIIVLAILQYVYNGCLATYRNNQKELTGFNSMTVARRMCGGRGRPEILGHRLSMLRWVDTSTCLVVVWLVAIYLFYLKQNR